MAKILQTPESFFVRIYKWPISYFVGLLIGLLVIFGFLLLDTNLLTHLNPTGMYLFLGGWVLMIGASFGEGINKILDIPAPTKLQIWIRRGSIVVGITLSTVAWTFFTAQFEDKGEQASSNNKFQPFVSMISDDYNSSPMTVVRRSW